MDTDRTYYRINGWDACFETAKSRTISNKSWGAYPLKHGAGYCRLMAKKTGPATYGVFIALASIVHARPKEIRRGYLTDTGGIPGYPYDIEDMAAMTRMNLAVVRTAITDLLKVRWISMCDSTGSISEDSPRILGGYHEDTTGPQGIPYTDRTDRTEEKIPKADALAAFEDFWKVVPNKIGKGKAREAYLKAIKNGATPEDIAAGLPAFAAYERKRSALGDYRPLHPSTWLNGERWSDEVGTGKPEQTGPKRTPIVVRFTDGRQPETYNLTDQELTECIERMKLVEVDSAGNQREFVIDAEMFEGEVV